MPENIISTNFDGIAESTSNNGTPPLWGSARLTYVICAFVSMVLQLCLRNTLNFAILCMVKPQQVDNSTEFVAIAEDSICGPIDNGTAVSIAKFGNILWTRPQEFAILTTFYYGYLVSQVFAGVLADKFGGKHFFVHSITVQAVIFMLIPFFAHRSYLGTLIIRTTQGLAAGFGNPALYQLFSVWAKPNERTAFISFAYGGYPVGSLLAFPITSFLCEFGWELAFYVIGSVSLVFGICCHWLVYSRLEDHPRLSRDEYDHLKATHVARYVIPWTSIFSSKSVYGFIITHICHSYGILVLTLLLPRFFKEAMRIPMNMVGLYSSAPFFGALLSKAVSIFFCSIIEKKSNMNPTLYRRFVYGVCNACTILFILGIILSTCQQGPMVVFLAICIGITSDIAFSAVYWPSLLYVAPAFTGVISGIANGFATLTGIVAPIFIFPLVRHGTKDEWNTVMGTLMFFYILGAIVYGLLGSSKLERWGEGTREKNNDTNNQNIAETQM